MDQATPAADSQEAKKLRNRLAQRAFRRRQAEAIKQLKTLAHSNQAPENERIKTLERENSQLRSQLADVLSSMSALQATVQTLTESVSKALYDTTLPADADADADADKDGHACAAEPPQATTHHVEKNTTPSSWLTTHRPMPADIGPDVSKALEPPTQLTVAPQDLDLTKTWPELDMATTSPLYGQIPKIWDFEYQMGPQPYLHAMTAAEQFNTILGKRWATSNSPFSDHINLLQQLLKHKLNKTGLITSPKSLARSLYQPILMLLSMFNSMTRPHMMDWYAKTRYFHIIDLTAWQIYPSLSTFGRLHERFRPTDVQEKNSHPRVIDWIAFPSLRDKLIQLHSANPQIDQIYCDVVNSYVVEATMSDLIHGAPPLNVYIRVTDLISAMSSLDESEANQEITLPAPDANCLFTMGLYARAAFGYLNMGRGVSSYKVEPALFGKYPELYDQEVMANGVPLKPDLQIILSPPKPLDPSTAETYHSFIDFYLDSFDTF